MKDCEKKGPQNILRMSCEKFVKDCDLGQKKERKVPHFWLEFLDPPSSILTNLTLDLGAILLKDCAHYLDSLLIIPGNTGGHELPW